MKKVDIGVGSFGIAFGALVILLVKLTGLKINTKMGLGSGFMPFVCAIVIIICGAGILIAAILKQDEKSEAPKKVTVTELKRFTVVICCGIFVCIATKYIGIIIALGIVVAAMAKLLGNTGWLETMLVGAGSAAVYWIIFGVILQVTLPTGLLGF